MRYETAAQYLLDRRDAVADSQLHIDMKDGSTLDLTVASQAAADEINLSCRVAGWAQIMAAGEPWMPFEEWNKMVEANKGIVKNAYAYVEYKNGDGVDPTSYNNLVGMVEPIGEVDFAQCTIGMSSPINIANSAFVNTIGARLELYDTDGAKGAALGAGVGAGVFTSFPDAFKGLKMIRHEEPDKQKSQQYLTTYQNWKTQLNKLL